MELSPTAPTERRALEHHDVPVQQLFRRWQEHRDEQAREALVKQYLPLARKLARRYRGAREPLDDLEQVASLGLVKAIDRYDSTRGIGFQHFAVPTILGELKRYFRDSGWAVHMPRGIQELALQVGQAERQLAAKSGREPTYNEVAEYLEISVQDVLEAAEASAAHHAVSFDTPHDDGDGEAGTLGDSIGQLDERFDLVALTASIAPAAKRLSERDRRVLALRFVEDKTQSEIADEVGVSQMQISRILSKALGQLAVAVDGERPPRVGRRSI
ncbi:MAG TPA: SigB/SigF/SigG family RNA polymerase sigma factor [Solirubrobacteraceae bacterium]|jgi:RNA polymerase sigma-B factor|nr:SigB/SigF/SigG family RNA polymerase sigma factor [Solirubrobacteraceae bacterium]